VAVVVENNAPICNFGLLVRHLFRHIHVFSAFTVTAFNVWRIRVVEIGCALVEDGQG